MKAIGINIYGVIGPFFDVVVLAFILYNAYKALLNTNSFQIIKASVIVLLAYVLVYTLHLDTLLWIINKLAPGIAISFAIVFQPEMRRLFLKIGESKWFSFGGKSKGTYIDAVLLAAEELAKAKRGMLVVFKRNTNLDKEMASGVKINADLSAKILITIFGHDTPLHDGACIVKGDKLLAAGCFLRISERQDIKTTFGTRHRAALGLSEDSDSVVLIVSEETGAKSLAYDSNLYYDLSDKDLPRILGNLLNVSSKDKKQEDAIDENKAQV